MELHQLRYFAKVAEVGHFTKAAELCHVSQPALSQQIAKLEREFGQPLFERLGRQVRLTDAGRLLQTRAAQILTLVDDARQCIADEPDAGRLMVAAIPTVAPYFLPPLLTRFAADCPRASIEVIEETTGRIAALLVAGEADLGIVALPLPEAGLCAEELFTEELQAVLPAGHKLANKPRLTLADLASEPFVLLHETHCLTGQALSFCARHAVAPVVVARIHQLATALELVRLGHGVSLVPAMAAAADPHPGRVYRTLHGERPTRRLAVAWHPARYRTKLFGRFLAALRS